MSTQPTPESIPEDLVALAVRALATVDGYYQNVPLGQSIRVMLAAVLGAQARKEYLRDTTQVVCEQDRGESPFGWSDTTTGPGPAEQELRGILATTRTRAQIDALAGLLRTEFTMAAQQQLDELHQGEEPHPDEAIVATPAQWIWRWNRSTPQRRLEVAAMIQQTLEERHRLADVRRYCELTLDSSRVQARQVAQDVLDLLDGKIGTRDAAEQSIPSKLTDTEQLRATLREVRSDLVKLYASLPDGLDFYLGRIRITRLRIDAALSAPTPVPEQPTPYTLTDPGRPTPRLIREIVEGARVQGAHCTEQTRLRNGTTVACTKADHHASPWHRRGAHSWKVVFGDAHAPRVPAGYAANRAADELGRLRTLAHDWRTALQTIAQQCRTCCTACDTAEAALAQHPTTQPGDPHS